MDYQIVRLEIPFYYLGNRDYVNGLTIFEEMLKNYFLFFNIGEHQSLIEKIKSFKINRFIRSNCYMEIQDGQVPYNRDAAAQMQLLFKDFSEKKFLLFEKNDKPVIERKEDYDRGIYINEIKNEKGGHEICLQNIYDSFTLVRAIIEANYRYCMAELRRTGAEGRASWVYMNHLKWPDSDNCKIYKKIEYIDKPMIYYKGKCHMIRKCFIQGLNDGFETELCFFFNNPKEKVK